jgi:hypothetical protein
MLRRLRRKLRAVRKRARGAKRTIKRARKVLKVSRKRAARLLKRIRRRKKALAEASQWGGSRGVTNRIIEIVGGRAAVTSRKRPANHPLSLANPGSDHNEANTTSDAVDFGIAEAFSLRDEVMRKLGVSEPIFDGAHYVITFNGKRYRVQPIARNHGTGPHLHFGVRAL